MKLMQCDHCNWVGFEREIPINGICPECNGNSFLLVRRLEPFSFDTVKLQVLENGSLQLDLGQISPGQIRGNALITASEWRNLLNNASFHNPIIPRTSKEIAITVTHANGVFTEEIAANILGIGVIDFREIKNDLINLGAELWREYQAEHPPRLPGDEEGS